MSSKLVKAKKKKEENVGLEVVESFLLYLMPIFAMVLCVFVPLYMKEGYYKIGTEKYNAYAHIVVFGMPVLLLLIFLWCLFKRKETGAWNLSFLKAQLSVTDCFVLAFGLVSFLSFVLSPYRADGFWGYDGWFMGFFSQITFVLLYVIYSRFGKGWQCILTVLCVVAFYTFTIGVLHRLLIDPIGVYDGISDYYKTQFLSTLGQASWYSSFICTVMPLGIVCFYLAKALWLRLISGLFTLVAFMTLVSQNSDSAYIAFACMLLVLLFSAVESAEQMMRLCEILLLFFAAPKLMQGLLNIHPNPTLDLDTLSMALIFGKLSMVMFLLVLCVFVFFWYMNQKQVNVAPFMKIVRNAVYLGLGILILAAIVILRMGIRGAFSANTMEMLQRIPYLTYSDDWGNGRGFTWTATAKIIREMPFVRKIIGVGPDCFASYSYEFYADYIRSKWGDNVLQNAHNEWMNMIVNEGFLGLVTYLGIYLSALVRFVKHRQNSVLLLAVATCVAAYVGHNIFCYQQVLCTPFIFLFMGLGEYQLRIAKEKER